MYLFDYTFCIFVCICNMYLCICNMYLCICIYVWPDLHSVLRKDSPFIHQPFIRSLRVSWLSSPRSQVLIDSFSFRTGPSDEQLDPVEWRLEASNDQNTWKVLHSQDAMATWMKWVISWTRNWWWPFVPENKLGMVVTNYDPICPSFLSGPRMEVFLPKDAWNFLCHRKPATIPHVDAVVKRAGSTPVPVAVEVPARANWSEPQMVESERSGVTETFSGCDHHDDDGVGDDDDDDDDDEDGRMMDGWGMDDGCRMMSQGKMLPGNSSYSLPSLLRCLGLQVWRFWRVTGMPWRWQWIFPTPRWPFGWMVKWPWRFVIPPPHCCAAMAHSAWIRRKGCASLGVNPFWRRSSGRWVSVVGQPAEIFTWGKCLLLGPPVNFVVCGSSPVKFKWWVKFLSEVESKNGDTSKKKQISGLSYQNHPGLGLPLFQTGVAALPILQEWSWMLGAQIKGLQLQTSSPDLFNTWALQMPLGVWICRAQGQHWLDMFG